MSLLRHDPQNVTFSIRCDYQLLGDQCSNETARSDSRDELEINAIEDGWSKTPGGQLYAFLWYCPLHTEGRTP